MSYLILVALCQSRRRQWKHKVTSNFITLYKSARPSEASLCFCELLPGHYTLPLQCSVDKMQFKCCSASLSLFFLVLSYYFQRFTIIREHVSACLYVPSVPRKKVSTGFWLDTDCITESFQQTHPVSYRQKCKQPKTPQVPSLQVSASVTCMMSKSHLNLSAPIVRNHLWRMQ